jgi:hypothetical protein
MCEFGIMYGVNLPGLVLIRKYCNVKLSNPITGLDRPWVFQEVESPRFQYNRHMKVVRLSTLRTGRLYPPEHIPGTHFCYSLSQPRGHSAAERIMSMKNSRDSIGNRTRDLPVCSAVPQPTAPPAACPHTVTCMTHFCNKLSGLPRGISEIELRNDWQNNEGGEEPVYAADK